MTQTVTGEHNSSHLFTHKLSETLPAVQRIGTVVNLLPFLVDYSFSECRHYHHRQVSTGAQRGSPNGQWNPEV